MYVKNRKAKFARRSQNLIRTTQETPLLKNRYFVDGICMNELQEQRPSGWWFPARVTLYFLIVASLAFVGLTYVGLRSLNTVHDDNVATRLQRASQASSALALERMPNVDIRFAQDGSPLVYTLDSEADLAPGPEWDSLLDTIGGANDGAANLFRFNSETNAFDRLSTTFRTPDGERAGGSMVEPGLLAEGHPAFQNLTNGEPFVGQVPVAGRLRLAYLTPVEVEGSDLTGAIAIDVGFVDDIDAINAEATSQSVLFGALLLLLTAIIGVIVMFLAFRPLHRLTEAVHNIGEGSLDTQTVQLTERRDEIGYLARGLTKVSDLQGNLEHRATTDDLTGIGNRAALVDELERRFAGDEGSTEIRPFAFMILNLDGFQGTRSALGQQASDELLTEVGASLQAALKPGEFVARLNGDEFAVLSEFESDLTGQAELAERISGAASGLFDTSGGTTRAKAGVGIVRIPQHATSTPEALRNADLALDEVKRADRGDTVLYHPRLSDGFERHLYLVSELRDGMSTSNFSLAYQPTYNRSGDLVAVEALARFRDAQGALVSPAEFIPIAEKAGLIDELGMWVIDDVCQQIDAWVRSYDWAPLTSVNVSPIQLLDNDFVSGVEKALERFPSAKGRLAFELSGNSSSPHVLGTRHDVLADLKELGIYLILDDFGTGNSPLSSLSELPVDQIKISQDFVQALKGDAEAAGFLADIVELGKGRGLRVGIKGIESRFEFKVVHGMACDLFQGYELGKPMPKDQLEQHFGVTSEVFDSAK